MTNCSTKCMIDSSPSCFWHQCLLLDERYDRLESILLLVSRHWCSTNSKIDSSLSCFWRQGLAKLGTNMSSNYVLMLSFSFYTLDPPSIARGLFTPLYLSLKSLLL